MWVSEFVGLLARTLVKRDYQSAAGGVRAGIVVDRYSSFGEIEYSLMHGQFSVLVSVFHRRPSRGPAFCAMKIAPPNYIPSNHQYPI